MFRGILILAMSLTSMNQTLALGTETFGNTPLADANFGDWPNVMPVINDTHRVYHSWVNGNENFFFQGDTESLNVALKTFAAIKAEKRTVILRPAPGSVSSFKQDKTFVINWQLHLLGGIAKHMSTRDQGSYVWDPNPELIVYVGGTIVLDKIEIPENVDVLQVADLKQRYANGLNSTHTDVRGWTCGIIAALDQYDESSMQTIAKVLNDKDNWVKLNAAGALSEFSTHRTEAAKALQAVCTDDDQLKERIQSSIQKLNGTALPFAGRETHQMQLNAISRFLEARHAAE